MKYALEELDEAALRDLLSDAAQAEAQAKNGPFYPERGITAEELRTYAARCRAMAKRYRNGGAHRAVLSGLMCKS